MNRVEQILGEYESFHFNNGMIDETHYYKGNVLLFTEQTALEFTKWKDENTYIKDGVIFNKQSAVRQTSEQLFNEWNNLNNKQQTT